MSGMIGRECFIRSGINNSLQNVGENPHFRRWITITPLTPGYGEIRESRLPNDLIQQAMKLSKIENSFNFILFGASGDLAQLKLFPALYHLALQKRFPKSYAIIGYARSEFSEEEFRAHVEKSIRKHVEKNLLDETILSRFLRRIHYHQGAYDNEKDYGGLSQKLMSCHKGQLVYNLAFLATPSTTFQTIAKGLNHIRQNLGCEVELMLEKPFGHDRKSAGELFQAIMNHFDKKHLFLIDHYLGKDPVKSIFPLRYNNEILNLMLHGQAISNIQISALETLGTEDRAGYFDRVGIIKDMIQSHLLQVLALFTMSMPLRREVKSVRREKGDVLSALSYPKSQCGVVIGQYESYAKEEGVKKNSNTPTFAAVRCFIDLTQWYKVPIYIRSGKKLSHKHTYVVVEFTKPPYAPNDLQPNRLIIELHPEEKIQIQLINEIGERIVQSYAQNSLACTGDECLPDYAGLILDAFTRRYESFLSIDEILASWYFVDSLYSCVDEQNIALATYKDGSNGPQSQHDLTKMDGFEWYDMDS